MAIILTVPAAQATESGPAVLMLADMDVDDIMRLKESGEILPLELILQQVQQYQPGRVIEIELEEDDNGYVYELEVVDEEGVVWDIDINARSGEFIERERDD